MAFPDRHTGDDAGTGHLRRTTHGFQKIKHLVFVGGNRRLRPDHDIAMPVCFSSSTIPVQGWLALLGQPLAILRNTPLQQGDIEFLLLVLDIMR